MRRFGARALLLLALLCIYGPLVVHDPLLGRDDHTLVDPLGDVHSVAEWVEGVRSGRILDLQPLRDLSLWFDVQLSTALGRGTFHFSNLVLWIAIGVLLFRLCRNDGVVAAFALHPVFVGAVAWVSARKHLLACLCTLGATLVVERLAKVSEDFPGEDFPREGSEDFRRGARKGRALKVSEDFWRGAAAVLLYLLAVLAQPIAILWPVWVLIRSRFARFDRRRPVAAVALACAPLMLAAAALNLRYYARGSKFAGESGVGLSLLAVGRSFLNLVAPARLAAAYDPASALNLCGLLLVPLFAALALRKVGQRAWLWLAFFALPLVPVTARMTNIFVSDTYLLLPGAGLALLLGAAQARLPKAAGAALLAGLFLLAVREARAWGTDGALWEESCTSEGAPAACARRADWLATHGRAAEALPIALDAAEREPANPLTAEALARSVALDPALQLADKIAILIQHRSDDAWPSYFLGSLLAQAGQAAGGEVLLRKALEDQPRLGRELPVVAAEAQWLCEHASHEACGEIVSRARAAPAWDERRYRARVEGLERR